MYVLFRAAEQETGSKAVSWSGEQVLMLIWATPVTRKLVLGQCPSVADTRPLCVDTL